MVLCCVPKRSANSAPCSHQCTVIIDRTAEFVRKAGVAFEKEIAQRNAKVKKFFFLKPTNPYHAYYQHRLKFGDAATEDTDAAAPPPPPTEAELKAKADEEEKKAAKKKAAKKKAMTLKEKLEGVVRGIKSTKVTPTEPPAKDKYSVKTPGMFHAQDL